MSQLYDYFVCSRPSIDRWAAALAVRDEELQQRIESEMPRSLTFKNIGQDEFNILAACVEGEAVDVAEAVGQVDLVRAITVEEGPWVLACRRWAVEVLAGMQVDEPLLGRWVRHVAELHGGTKEQYQKLLSAEAARKLKGLCGVAVERGLGVFICFYG